MITCPYLGNAGRLGNQLWQLASTIGIARKYGESVCFPKWDYQPYFSVPEHFFVDQPYGASADQFVPHIDERARIYLQDWHLWSDIEPEIRAYFQPSQKVLDEIAQLKYMEWFSPMERPVLSVHVRRGDNVSEGEWKKAYHPPRPNQYYLDAVKAAPQHKTLMVFSDDIAWCKEEFPRLFPEENLSFFDLGVSRPKEHEPEYATAPVLDWIDFFLMIRCDYHIISNSTYSWWAAYLSKDQSPIYPVPWFGPALQYINAELMFPPSWKRVQHAD